MTPLSAIDAISPALERARRLLIEPFSLKRFVKIGLLAFLGITGGAFLINIGQVAGLGVALAMLGKLSPMPILGGLLIVIAILAVLGVAILYLSSRARLTDLWMIATGDTSVGRAWVRSGLATWRFAAAFLIWVAIMTAGIFAIAAIFFSVITASIKNGGEPKPEVMLPLIMMVWVAIIPLMFVATAVQIFIRDFMAVPLLFEDASIGTAWKQSRQIVQQSLGQCGLFLLIYFVMGIIVGFAAEIGILVVLAVSAIPGGLIGFGLYELWKTVGHVAQLILIGIGGAIGVAWIAFVISVLFGAGQMVLQCYSAYFVGSRNRVLGDMLQPPPGPSPV
jgi:hypothetical protein